MAKEERFDVIVVGGGHAGCEAYAASCRVGARTAMIVPSFQTVGFQPCNPAVGGPGKGHLVREIAALGGLMGKVTDESGIQFRTLNRRKGPAVRSTRVQTDAAQYVLRMMDALLNIDNPGTIIEDLAVALLWDGSGSDRAVKGVRTDSHGDILCKGVVVTAGTYLRGMLFEGEKVKPGGRRGAGPSVGFAESLESTGLPMMRLKTGTCPRLAGDSIDTAALEEQFGDTPPPFFAEDTKDVSLPQRSCFLTYTGEKCHEIIASSIMKSAMYGGGITGVGPRYCPSIETKIERFPDKVRHQIFLEPEDVDGRIIYPSGLSTSFPADVQKAMVQAIPGLENARIVHYGYAVEYDAFQPQCLKPSLEVDGFRGLFLAGQILGTSGYEEAASLGLFAGANAALGTKGAKQIHLTRDMAYLGVMIDDLTGRGVDEPYRMFTSRAEYRLLLREDNAAERLLDVGAGAGLISSQREKEVGKRIEQIQETGEMLAQSNLTPTEETNGKLLDCGFMPIKKPTTLFELIRREGIRPEDVAPFCPKIKQVDSRILDRVETDIKYSGYLERQQIQADRLKEVDMTILPTNMNFEGMPGMRGELIEKLTRARPSTLGQASRIPGMTPAAVEILRVYIKKYENAHLQENTKRDVD